MLSDEEKKAIDYWKGYMKILHWNTQLASEYYMKILLDLIEKQSKEIEELKNITKSYDSFLGTEKIVIADKKFFVNGYFRENYVSKDEIKAKIEEIDNILKNNRLIDKLKNYFEAQKEVLQSLLEKE